MSEPMKADTSTAKYEPGVEVRGGTSRMFTRTALQGYLTYEKRTPL